MVKKELVELQLWLTDTGNHLYRDMDNKISRKCLQMQRKKALNAGIFNEHLFFDTIGEGRNIFLKHFNSNSPSSKTALVLEINEILQFEGARIIAKRLNP